ncbi:hypothetical protein F2Q69_00022072 [Brassica cretica]|uniref:Uncharacterized protein n=1 Tax=Brassica cretica TaxID=69181 RepID=A0A8S9QKW1_BRACR|nr:hypothetical protein F2Q69_00022072 [Brassica cretica]
MEDVLSRAWAHVKREEDAASRAKAQQKQELKVIRPDRNDQDERPSPRSIKDSGNRNQGKYKNYNIRDDSVHVARDLSTLYLKAGAGQCSEADGPTGQVVSKDEST